MSAPVLDEARLAAIQAAADDEHERRRLMLATWHSRYLKKPRWDTWSLEYATELLALVGVLQAENQRLREQIERHQASGCHALPEPPRLLSAWGSPEADAKFNADMKAIRDAERAVDLNRVIGGAVSDGD